MAKPDKALPPPAIPLCSIAAGELGRLKVEEATASLSSSQPEPS
jgi:hypothetical protein